MARKPDKFERGREFFRRVARDGAYAPIFTLFGEERFLVNEGLHRIEQAVFPNGRDDFNFAAYHTSESKLVDVLSAAEMLPMLASRRIVMLAGGDKLKAADFEHLLAYAERPLETTVLVIEAVKFDRRSKKVASFLKHKNVEDVEFPVLRERDVRSWVQRRARAKGLHLASSVPDYLVDAVGTSLGELDRALERVDLYLGQGCRRRGSSRGAGRDPRGRRGHPAAHSVRAGRRALDPPTGPGG